MLSGHRKNSAASSMAMSSRWPMPLRSRATKAEAIACAAVMEVILSQIRELMRMGRSLPGLDCNEPMPEIDWMMASYTRRLA